MCQNVNVRFCFAFAASLSVNAARFLAAMWTAPAAEWELGLELRRLIGGAERLHFFYFIFLEA